MKKKLIRTNKAEKSLPKSTTGKVSCTGRELAEALRKADLSPEDAKAWHDDLMRARKTLTPLVDWWR
jgi:hypothetical protein